MAEGAEVLLAYSSQAKASRSQVSLFDESDATLASRPRLPEQEDWDQNERLAAEQEAVGFYLSAHPLDSYEGGAQGPLGHACRPRWRSRWARGTTRFRLAGVVLSVRERGPGSRRYAFIQLSDPSGSFEVAAFRETYSDGRGMLEPGKAVLVTAQARIEGDEVKLSAQSFDDLEARLTRNLSGLAVYVHDPARTGAAGRDARADRPAGGGRIALFVETGGEGTVEVELPESYALSPTLGGEIGALAGVRTVQVLPAARAGISPAEALRAGGAGAIKRPPA